MGNDAKKEIEHQKVPRAKLTVSSMKAMAYLHHSLAL